MRCAARAARCAARDLAGVNLATRLADGEQVRVPRRAAAVAIAGGTATCRCTAGSRTPQQRECRAARCARRHRPGAGAAHRRLPRGSRRLRLDRSARRGQRHRPGEARVAARATGAVTGGTRADEIGTVAAPWLAAGLAAPALAASGPMGIALVVLAPLLLRLHCGQLPRPAACAAASCLVLGSLWSVHGIAALAADPLRTQIGHVEHARLVVQGQPRPGPFGSAAVARLDGHPVELRARSALQQGAIVEVERQPGAGATVRRRLRSPHLAGTPGSPRDAHCTLARRDRHAGRHARGARPPPPWRARSASRREGTTNRAASQRASRWAGAPRSTTARSRSSALRPRATCWPSPGATSCCWSPPSSPSAGWPGCRDRWPTAARSRRWWRTPRSSAAVRRSCGPQPPACWCRSRGWPARRATRGICWRLRQRRCSALDPWAVVGPGFQLSFVAVAAIHGLAPRHPRLAGGDGRARAPVRPARDLAGLHRRDGAGRVVHFGRASLVAGLPGEPARPAGSRATALARTVGMPALADRARRGGRLRLAGACAGRLHRADRPPRRLARRRAAGSGTARSRSRGGALAWLVRRRPAAALAARARRTAARARMARRASVAAAGTRAPRHVPGRGTGRRHADRGAGCARRSSTPARPRPASSGSCARRGVDSLDALVLSHDERDHDGRAAAIVRIAARGGARHPRPAGHSENLRAAIGEARARGDAACRDAAARARAAAGPGGAARARAAARDAGRRRRTARPWSSWRARGRARSCCPPTPSRPCLLRIACHRSACWRWRTTARPTPGSERLLARVRPGLAVISVGDAQLLRASGARDAGSPRRGGRAGAAHGPRGRRRALAGGCGAEGPAGVRRPVGVGDAATITAMSAAHWIPST